MSAEEAPRLLVYVDSSVLFKRYVREAGTLQTDAFLNGAERVATSEITRAEYRPL